MVSPDGNILAVRSNTAPRRALQWDLPGGLVDEGEEAMKSVVRETKEEAGLSIEYPKLVHGMSESSEYRLPGTYDYKTPTW